MTENGPAGRRRINDRSEHDRAGAVPRSFPPLWTEPDVKGLLLAMQGCICAYCGSHTNGLDVDHFRPKGMLKDDEAHGGYWWLAYDCSNYFLGCPTCNRYRKGNSFPLLPGAARCDYDTRDTIAAEERILLDATIDPVEEWLTIERDDLTARLIPAPILGETQQTRVEYAIEFFGLNLPGVRTQRSKVYEEAARAAAEQRWDELRRSAMRHRHHSIAARIVLQREAAERLPSPDEETKDLADLLWRDLRTFVSEIRTRRLGGKEPRPMDERQLRALCWALLVLRSDPPSGNPAAVDDYLGELLEREPTEVRTQIVALFRRLPGALGSGGIMIV
jgi:uncharacterized protein (TIGR02646 family)